MADYKQLCAELVNELHGYKVAHPNHDTDLIDRARAALAEPEPEGLPVWTEGICGDGATLLRDGVMVPIEEVVRELNRGAQARAVLARWGSPAPQPIPVTERLPGPEDCMVISWSEIRSPHVWAGKRRLINGPTEIWDWTFASIPCLEESGEFTHWLPASASVLPAGAIRQSNTSA